MAERGDVSDEDQDIDIESDVSKCDFSADNMRYCLSSDTVIVLHSLLDSDNNNNNLRLLKCSQTAQSTHYQHPPRRAGHNSRHVGQHYIQKG